MVLDVLQKIICQPKLYQESIHGNLVVYVKHECFSLHYFIFMVVANEETHLCFSLLSQLLESLTFCKAKLYQDDKNLDAASPTAASIEPLRKGTYITHS